MKPVRHAFVLRAFSFLTILGLGLLDLPDRFAIAAQSIYDRLNGADASLAKSVLQEALENRGSQEIRLWRSESSGHAGSVMPLRTFKIKTGHYCRDYRETLLIDREMVSRVGTACRSSDGTWISVER